MIKIIITIIVLLITPTKPDSQVSSDEAQDPLYISEESLAPSRKPAMENFDSFRQENVAKPKNNQ